MFSAAMSATDFGRAGPKDGPDPYFAVLVPACRGDFGWFRQTSRSGFAFDRLRIVGLKHAR